MFTEIVDAVNSVLWSEYILIPILIVSSIYFSIRTGFVQITLLNNMFGILKESNTGDAKNSISSFQAFTISAASRIGTGNIAGVAMAIVIGGPGAIFWMWFIAIFASASAFIESTLAQIYKTKDLNTGFRGGPAYYMEKALNARWLGYIFVVLISIAFPIAFNMIQINTITGTLASTFNISENNVTMFRFLIGFTITVVVMYIIFGGGTRIAHASQVIVPVMALFYLAIVILVTLFNLNMIPFFFKEVIGGAFTPRAAGAGLIPIIIVGFKRGLFSNEAGMGSAPNAAASATTSHPAKQGLLQALGVYFDTLLICTATAFVVVIANVHGTFTADAAGANVTISSLDLLLLQISDIFTGFAPIFMSIAIFFFAFSSILGNYFYGESNIEFITKNKLGLNIFRTFVGISLLYGSFQSNAFVWGFGDLTMGLMAIVNIIVIVLLSNKAIIVLKDYRMQLKDGKDPQFKASDVGITDAEVWE